MAEMRIPNLVLAFFFFDWRFLIWDQWKCHYVNSMYCHLLTNAFPLILMFPLILITSRLSTGLDSLSHYICYKSDPKKLWRISAFVLCTEMKRTNLVSLHLVFLKCGDVLRICICQASYHYMHVATELFATSTRQNFCYSISKASPSHCGELWYMKSTNLMSKN